MLVACVFPKEPHPIDMPPVEEWKYIVEEVKDGLTDFKNYYWSRQWVTKPQVTPTIEAKLAVRILRESKFSTPTVGSDRSVEVRREVEFWAETLELKGQLRPAVTLTVNSKMLYKGNLNEFYENHPYRNNPDELLINMKVRDLESWGYGTITGIVGTIGEHREKLIEQATGAMSKEALQSAPEDQPVVAVQFGKKEKKFHYAMAALRPCITSETAERFGVEYGKLLKKTKIPYQERQKLLQEHKEIALAALAPYGFKLDLSVNSRSYPSLFSLPQIPLVQTPLLFGKGITGVQNKILNGLSTGSVYRRHHDYKNGSKTINVAVLKLCDFKIGNFVLQVQQTIKSYNFDSELVNKEYLSVKNLSGAQGRAEVEKLLGKLLDKLVVPTPDIVLTFLPESDRHADNKPGGSLYYWVYSRLLRRGIASQVIYEDTLTKVGTKYILNQVIPGILAKLGNLPFVLAEPLEVADYFVGLDVARVSKKKVAGSKNACASIRLYHNRGEFIRYRLEDSMIEGETIPPEVLETLLSASDPDLTGKTVLIYRDGSFCGDEVKHLVDWAEAIGSKFILVECRKSGVPRLYNLVSQSITDALNQKKTTKVITAPEQGLALRLSSREAILVTTKVPQNVGLARPLRLTIREEGHQTSIEKVVETTLKLTLLHHGALKTPRLPMPLYGSDRMAYLRLRGIYPTGMLEGDRQFWL